MDVCTDNNSFSGAFSSYKKNTCDSPQEYKICEEDLNGPELSSIGNEGLTSEDLRIALSELHMEVFHETESFEDRKERLREMGIPFKKLFVKSPTFPCPGKVNTSLGGFGASNGESSCELQRCISLPTTPRLISAMKGGREREGDPPRTKMQVKWAKDVYDPPATSMSHTLRNNKPKKPKKDDHKLKHKKKKKKSANRVKEQESGSNRAHTWQEAKCGSSLMAGQLEKLQFSVAEAT